MTFARFRAIISAGAAGGEWTAPTTPVVLFYRKWPDPGSGEFKPGRDAFIVGTIGDLHDWVRRDRADFDFLWRTIIFGLLSACVGVALALADTTRPGGPPRWSVNHPGAGKPVGGAGRPFLAITLRRPARADTSSATLLIVIAGGRSLLPTGGSRFGARRAS